MSEKTIYELDLHECFTMHDIGDSGLNITKVPGGWLYTLTVADNMSTTFVPEPKPLPGDFERVTLQHQLTGGTICP